MWRRAVAGAKILAGNDYEFGMIAEKLGIGEAELRRVAPVTVMTKGEAGALITVDGEEYEIPPAKPEKVVDPTGAGDAFQGGVRGGDEGRIAVAGGGPDGGALGRVTRSNIPGRSNTVTRSTNI